jgi:hypothetical protein
MNYWALWDGFSKVKKNSDESVEVLYYFIEFLTHKIQLEKEYAAGLLRLTRAAVFNRGKNTVKPALEKIQSYCNQLSSNLNQLIDQQELDLIPSLKNLLVQHQQEIKTNSRKAYEFDDEMKKYIKKYQKSKEKYFYCCEKNQTPDKDEENALKDYVKIVEDANKFCESFEENMKGILLAYQSQEENRLKTLKDSFMKLVVYEVALFRSNQYELDSLPIAIESFKPEIEIGKFIDDSSTGKKFPKFVVEVHSKKMIPEISIMTHTS